MFFFSCLFFFNITKIINFCLLCKKNRKILQKKCKSFRSPNDNLHKHEYMRKYDNSPNGAILGQI
nr:MAG TPA: hypothetical protein [Caudoviricetes sp.]